jgi:ABC-type phosphate transport system substrate-binding protein
MGRHKGARTLVALTAAALLAAGGGVAWADPVPDSPGTPPNGVAAIDVVAGVGADAFAEAGNYLASQYNGQAPAPAKTLASYDAVNPVTGDAGETITTKPGCDIVRPNGANAALSAIKLNQMSTVDSNAFCIDYVRASRAKLTNGTENMLTFYAFGKDAVTWVGVSNAYAPTTSLSKAQLKGIFECSITDWSEVGGQAGAIHVYLPPTSAATRSFFVGAIGTSDTAIAAGCGSSTIPTQQNDGRQLNADPQAIVMYGVSKWASQFNGAPGSPDNRGGTVLGKVDNDNNPIVNQTINGTKYKVTNPAFSIVRLLFNATRNDAPNYVKNTFTTSGFLCDNQDALLVPFGIKPLGSDTGATNYCGQES